MRKKDRIKNGITDAKLATAKTMEVLNILETAANLIENPNLNDFKKLLKYLKAV